MSITIVETFVKQPLTNKQLDAIGQSIFPSVEARDGTWLYSLLSSDHHRMICAYDASDAQVLQEAYCSNKFTSSSIWAASLITPEGSQPQRHPALLTVIEGTYPPMSEEKIHEASRKTLPCYSEHGIEWIQSYISSDRTRIICELNAPDLESVRVAQRRLDIPFDRVWSAQVLSPETCSKPTVQP